MKSVPRAAKASIFGVLAWECPPRQATQSLRSSIAMKRTLGLVCGAAITVAAARVAVDFAKSNDKLTIVGGGLGEKELDLKGVEALAKLPSLDRFCSQVCLVRVGGTLPFRGGSPTCPPPTSLSLGAFCACRPTSLRTCHGRAISIRTA